MMGVLWMLVVILMLSADTMQEAKFGQLPRLDDLDDYEWCLAQPHPLYCLGTFRLSPRSQPSPVFDLIQEYSKDPLHFNRTLLHRGYCVSSRCSLNTSILSNTTSRFENCVQHELEPFGLRASLQTINYCKSKEDDVSIMDTPRLVFLIVIGIILTSNVFGTICDVIGVEKNRKLWKAWSVRANWQRLTDTYEGGDPHLTALAPIQGVRVLMLLLVILGHACLTQHRFYLSNPQAYELGRLNPLSVLILNGTSIVQAFVFISNFLFSYSVLTSRTRGYTIAVLPLYFLHRIVRFTPLHLLMVGFAATWWRDLGSGPLWAPLVGAESDICREKFWTHALYINNFVRGDDNCMIHTWFIAMDMQLYLVASLVLLVTIRMRRCALPLLGILFIISCVMNAVLAYVYDWKPLLYFSTPKDSRNTFRGVPSFTNFYVMPWGSLPACLCGLFHGHLQFEIQERSYKITKHKWLMRVCVWSVPLMALWWLSGYYFREYTSRVATTAFLALERPLFVVLAFIYSVGNINNIDNFQRRLLSWRGFRALGRLSLSALMLHWCINTQLVAARSITHTSVVSVAADTVTTGFFSYLLAVPLTILVEYPIQKTFT